MILDTNILIYAAAREFPELDVFLSSGQFAASVITRIEALGFTRLDETEKTALNALFAKLRLLPLNDTVANRAIDLRQQRKMSLADAIIAATALVHGLPLVTRNVEDYKHIAYSRYQHHQSLRAKSIMKISIDWFPEASEFCS